MGVQVNGADVVSITSIDLAGGTDIGANLADGDLLLVDDGGGGTLRKTAMSRVSTYIPSKLSVWAQPVTATPGSAVLVVDDTGDDKYGAWRFQEESSCPIFVTLTIPSNMATLEALYLYLSSSDDGNLRLAAYGAYGGPDESRVANGSGLGFVTIAMVTPNIVRYDITGFCASWDAGDMLGFRLERQGGAAQDTVADVYVHGILLEGST